jgi:sugar (pentulose or hexulose) kinase
VFSDAASAIDSHLKIKKIYLPNPDIKALYDERYELYKKFYPAVKEINHIL